MVKLLNKERYTLCIDRTNWKFGRLTINILMLAVVDDGLPIPLAFVLLDKAGSCNTLERISLMEQFLKVIDPQQIEALLADREFIGKGWFKFLSDHNIPFAIRIRENSLADEWFRLSCFFTTLDTGQHKQLQQRDSICGCELAGTAARSVDGQLVILVTNCKPAWALRIYAPKWQIVCLFKALKSSGFKLEDTHRNNLDRLSLLLAVVSLAFLWALMLGHWLHQNRPLRLKSHGRREKSIFRLGLDLIRRAITNLALDKQPLDDAFRVLSCT